MTAEAVKSAVSNARAMPARMNGHAEPKNVPAAGPKRPANPLEALERWMVTDEQVNTMKKTKMIWRDMVALSHLMAWIAPANGGKTTIAKFAAGELAHAGYTVLFFQEDASAGDLPALHQHAKDHGYTMLNSTLAGSSPDEQIKALRGLVRDGADLGNTVMIFDTLKKYTDLMSKGGTRAFFQLMRSLTQRGATVVLLGHTNKHRGPDGKLIFEGVGDVRNDVDDLLYIDATDKDPAGLVTLTMRPDKVRCMVRETTFQLNTTAMEIRALDRVVDVATINATRQQREDDEPLIQVVKAALSAHGGMNHTELMEKVTSDSGRSKAAVRKVIDRYMSEDPADPHSLWTETRLSTHNARRVSLKS